jgi:hypothetical protein
MMAGEGPTAAAHLVTVSPEGVCGRCRRPVPPGYRLRGGELRCWRHVIGHPSVYRRSLITALIVGTILTAINQGNRILDNGFTLEILVKMGLTYCVPFCVSTFGALGATRIFRGSPA